MSLKDTIGHYISISNSPSAIDFDAVFEPNYPPEAWAETFKQANLGKDRENSLRRLVRTVITKTPEERKDLVETLCKPKLRIHVKIGADKEHESEEIARQLVIKILSSSEENLKNMKQALENIR